MLEFNAPEKYVGDVLFVNGCDPAVAPHPYRYRVQHQREQLYAFGLSSNEVYYVYLKPEIVTDYRVILFYRCPYTDAVGDAIKLAHKLNKTVVYDIDDLVIDTKYTDLIPYVQGLEGQDKVNYNDGVIRMGKTLKLCDCAITTTERLKEELENYVPEVFINRNRASDDMVRFSQDALAEKEKAEKDDSVVIGYFSGSITHNADVEMILPVLKNILQKYPQARLLVVGELDIPSELEELSSQILHSPFVSWQDLPKLISKADINIAPIEDTIFNEAKSENKWMEAALVKVPTVASDLGAFRTAIRNHETGILCSGMEEWQKELEQLVLNAEERKRIAENAYTECMEHYLTIASCEPLARFLMSKMAPHAAFVLPSLQISGGIMVALSHASILQDAGWDVDVFATEDRPEGIQFRGHGFNTVDYRERAIDAAYDLMVATMWTTVSYVADYSRAERKVYLVQNYEPGFYDYGVHLRLFAEQTYYIDHGMDYLTISRWCQDWLENKYHCKNVGYLPNGLWSGSYHARERNFDGRIRILIEGDCAVAYKGVDESFEIVSRLDPEKFEVWYLSYNAEPKKSYRVDRFFSRVAYEKVGLVYEQCDILLKSSYLESFSYPPIEMMATGGLCVAVLNDGNQEYVENEYNCLTYDRGDIEGGVRAIKRICEDAELRKKLQENGLETARKRGMEAICPDVLSYYESGLKQ